MKDDTFDQVLSENLSVYESHVNYYYMAFKKLLDENRRSFYNHEFLFILFDSDKFKNLLLTLESVDKNYGFYQIKRDFYWTGNIFKKCLPKNDFCHDLVREKMKRISPLPMHDL